MEVKRRRTAKNRRRTTLRLLLLSGVLLLIAAGVVAGVLLLGQSAKKEAALTPMPFTPADNARFTGAGFLYLQGGSLYYHDLANPKASYHAEAKSPDVKLAGSAKIHAAYNNAKLKIVNAAYPVEFTGTLMYVTCGSTSVAALRADPSGTESIQVFAQDASQKAQLDFAGQFIEDYGFYTSGISEYLYVLTLSLESGTPLSTITIYDMTRSATIGVMQVQSQLIEHIYFTSAGIYAVGTNQIIRYSLAGNRESYREMVYGFDVMDFDASSSPMFLLRPRSSEKPGTVKLMTLKDADVAGTAQRLLQLPAGAIDAFLMGGRLVAVTAGGYSLYSAEGKLLSSRTFDAEAVSAMKLDSSTLLINSKDACYTVKVG